MTRRASPSILRRVHCAKMEIIHCASVSLLLILLSIPTIAARDIQYITGTSITGVTQQLDVARTPALYTGDFGDCLGGPSPFNITRFDAAYYSDNSTVLFHLDGQSSIGNESLVMRVSMDAYGENRFQKTFDPCSVNIDSLCHLNAMVPIEAWAIFPVGAQQVGDIPSLAFSVPDFEGSVKLQIFGNTTQSEIGCFQASLTNGNTMGYPQIISPVLALFVLVALLASFVTAAYGVSIPAMRSHYAHSLSVMIVFESFQSIFFSGALQLDFPSVLPAWWSNFAWASGQVFSQSVLNAASITSGIHGNASQVSGNGSSVLSNPQAEEALAHQIYGRSIFTVPTSSQAHHLSRRYNASDPFDYTWAGTPVAPGLVLPATWTGFPGTLSALGIPAADTFAVGLIWLLAFVAALISALAIFKFSLEALVSLKRIHKNAFVFFRRHWIQYMIAIVLRTSFGALAMIMTLAFFQLSFNGSADTKALAAAFSFTLLLGLGIVVTYACYTRRRGGKYHLHPDRMVIERHSKFKIVPYMSAVRISSLENDEQTEKPIASFPWLQVGYHDSNPNRTTVHQDEPYIQRFGWLSARYRKTRWWYFEFYFAYQLIRAAIVGGLSSNPTAQVSALLAYDVVAFFIIVNINPFEGRRNTALGVWMLGISKILTTGLSVAFLPAMNVNRIIATALGIIIIVVQGLLTIGVMILVVLGVISSYMSITRDREPSKPGKLDAIRARYFSHLETRAVDIRITRSERNRLMTLEKEAEMNATPPEPSFTVNSVRRIAKIYDEDEDVFAALQSHSTQSIKPCPASFQSGRSNLPRAARLVRASWSSQDFGHWDARSSKMMERSESGMARRLSSYSGHWVLNNALSLLQEEDYDEYEEMSSGVSGSGSLEPKRPLTPANDWPSSCTAVVTPQSDRGEDGSIIGKREAWEY